MTDDALILNEAQLAAMASPVRSAIVRELSMGPLSVTDLAQRTGRAAVSLYHHVARLEAVGLVRAAGERPGARRPQALYGLVARRLLSTAAVETPGGRRAMARLAASVARQSARAIVQAADDDRARPGGPERNVAARHLVLRLDAERLAQLNRMIEDFARDAMQTSAPDGDRTVLLTVLLAPGR